MDPVSAVANAVSSLFTLGSSIAGAVSAGKQGKAATATAQQETLATQALAAAQIRAAQLGIEQERQRAATAAYEAAGQRALAQAQMASQVDYTTPLLILGGVAIAVVLLQQQGRRR